MTLVPEAKRSGIYHPRRGYRAPEENCPIMGCMDATVRAGRRSIRLEGYDYSQTGGYFVTLVTLRRECLFGAVMNGEMRENALGIIVRECWEAIPRHFPNAEVDAFVVMPNHVHGILMIYDQPRRGTTLVPEAKRSGIYRAPTGFVTTFVCSAENAILIEDICKILHQQRSTSC